MSSTISIPNLPTAPRKDFNVSSIPSIIGAISVLVRSTASSARSRLSITGNSSLANLSNANLWAFSTSCSVRRRIFSTSALARKMASRSRCCACLSCSSSSTTRGSTTFSVSDASALSALFCCSDTTSISSETCSSGTFCSLLLMNISAYLALISLLSLLWGSKLGIQGNPSYCEDKTSC
ncbi:conserved hypothetical protein [Photorhabdus asymbiotica]|uniref:Uncharacterized protein n=1 Tax=Photorhabdus asymbiotica subsp. asymbiotica (strain ATCC 43949 / 3105-77) TaxID=553480 RepID=C7BRG6_PHOAA|nr:conserved hypothetical protein [Photorhabdus asymbiotica]